MSAQLLDGNTLAKSVKAQVKEEVAAFASAHGVAPALAVVQIGEDEAAAGYARAIEKNCKSVGVSYQPHALCSSCLFFLSHSLFGCFASIVLLFLNLKADG